MEVAHVDRTLYISFAVKEFTTIRPVSLNLSLYTVVRACIKAAETYSYQVTHLHRGGMGELVLAALSDVIDQLRSKERITEEVHRELRRQYQRDAVSPLPEIITELMQLQGVSPQRARR